MSCDDGTYRTDSYVQQWLQLISEAAEEAGMDLQVARKIKDMLQEAGFIGVDEFRKKVPVGRWPKGQRTKYIGVLAGLISKSELEPFASPLLTRYKGMSREEVRELCRNVVGDITRGDMHIYYRQ